MKKPIIFLDFDGLKFNTMPIFVSYINKKYGINIREADLVGGPLWDTVINQHLPHSEHVSLDKIYYDASIELLSSYEWHENVEPMEDMTDVVHKMAKRYTLWTVTAREKIGSKVLQMIIDKHIPNCISGIHCVWDRPSQNDIKFISKKDFILNLPGDKIAFLDDSPKEVIKIQDHLPSFLFDPNSLHKDDKRIKNRLDSWREIGNYFL